MRRAVAVSIMVLVFSCLPFAQRQFQSRQLRADEAVSQKMGVVKGTVTMLNHEQLGKAPFDGASFIIQRADCPQAAVAVHADVEGRYAISLSSGRYRIINYVGRGDAGRRS